MLRWDNGTRSIKITVQDMYVLHVFVNLGMIRYNHRLRYKLVTQIMYTYKNLITYISSVIIPPLSHMKGLPEDWRFGDLLIITENKVYQNIVQISS